MKTLLLTLEYPPFHGGVANYYGQLVKYWPKTDDISVLNNNHGHLIYNKLPFLKWLPAFFSLRKKITQEKINYILAGQILPLGTVAFIFSRFSKIKYSVFLHGLDLTNALKQPRKKWLSEKILRNANKIICLNSYTTKMARQAFPDLEKKIIMINPGVENPAAHNPQLATQLKEKYNLENKIILLSVGRLIKRKGFDMVIETMPKILKPAPNLIYVILGEEAEMKNYELRITTRLPDGQDYELKNKVLIINNASDEERDLWYNICDIFIMPSRNINGDFEGFGLVYLEANLAGKPVIASKSGGVGDAVIDGLNGLLVDPEDTGQIASAVIKLTQNPALRQRLGEQGRERALKKFNWEKQIDKIYKAITI